MIKPNLWQKLAAVIAALMLMCCMALLALQMRANTRHEQEVVQRLSLGLAEHIAQRSELMDTSGMRDAAVRALFGQLMAVNPSVEVYLLDDQGHIRGHDAPSGHLIVCEDQYTDEVDNHIRGITPDGRPYDVGKLKLQTELAGACFSPDGKWMFVNAYGPTHTLAITGPWVV